MRPHRIPRPVSSTVQKNTGWSRPSGLMSLTYNREGMIEPANGRRMIHSEGVLDVSLNSTWKWQKPMAKANEEQYLIRQPVILSEGRARHEARPDITHSVKAGSSQRRLSSRAR